MNAPSLQREEPIDEPGLDVVRAGVDVDGEVEQVAEGEPAAATAGCSTFRPSTMRMSGRRTTTSASGMMS